MPFLGNIIKGALTLRDKLKSEDLSAVKQQKETLEELLSTCLETDFGKYYKFDAILEGFDLHASFAEHIPVFSYEKMRDEWWYRTEEGEEDITWPGRVDYFALSSGTTGNTSKRIPVTTEMIDSIRQVGTRLVLSLNNFDLPAEVFEREILMLGSSTDLVDRGHSKEGEISGISASQLPGWFEGYYRPGKDISAIEDWEERVQRIAEEAPNWNIGGLSGIPAWIELMLKKIIEHNKLDTIHDIWPDLTIYSTGGVAFEPYRKNFEKLLAHPLTYVDTYLASEGFLAYQSRPETSAMKLALDAGVFYEFVPFDENNFDGDSNINDHPQALTIDQVEEGKDYALIISTCAGAWRYMIGDTVRFTDVERQEIVITGRTKHFLNVAGSQLSVEKMNVGIQKLEEHFDISIKEFTVSAVAIDGGFKHSWYLGTDDQLDTEAAKDLLDKTLREMNKNYNVARGRALKDIEIHTVVSSSFDQWLKEKKKMGGQIKMPRVMKEDDFKEWEEFVSQNQQKQV